ncbi:MAG: nucleoside hydrolase [Ruminococcaceae bacterium]|nr:nucleoside hydrolase [Oscillospiraceae bacterium]
MAKKVILDVDTGSDDAVAIMTAIGCEDLDIVAICTVWGNLEVEDTTINTLELVSAMGADDIPVYRGCPTAMVKYLDPTGIPFISHAPIIKDGKELSIHSKRLGGLKPTEKKPEDIDAVSFYVNYLKNAKEKVTLIPVGPLTNLGEALSIAPEIVENIEEIVIMGGGDSLANVSPCAEANIWHDPEAATIVANCGAPVLWIPLDATHSAALDMEDVKTLKEVGTFASKFAAGQVEQRIEFENAAYGEGKNDSAIHDALAVCAVIDRSVLTEVEKCNVKIGLFGFGAGETIIDRRRSPDEPNCEFAFKASKEKFMEMLCEYLGKENA